MAFYDAARSFLGLNKPSYYDPGVVGKLMPMGMQALGMIGSGMGQGSAQVMRNNPNSIFNFGGRTPAAFVDGGLYTTDAAFTGNKEPGAMTQMQALQAITGGTAPQVSYSPPAATGSNPFSAALGQLLAPSTNPIAAGVAPLTPAAPTLKSTRPSVKVNGGGGARAGNGGAGGFGRGGDRGREQGRIGSAGGGSYNKR